MLAEKSRSVLETNKFQEFRLECGAISTSGCHKQSKSVNEVSRTVYSVLIATQKCKFNCSLHEYSGYVLEYSRRVGVP